MEVLHFCRRRSRLILGLGLIIGLVFVYDAYERSIDQHGTFFPFNVWRGSNLYQRPTSSSRRASPPKDYIRPKKNNRIVFSLSTLPKDLPFINDTLNSIVQQTLPPDAIHINLPYKSRRTGLEYIVPDYLRDGAYYEYNGRRALLRINRGEDYGPLTKLFPTLLVETDPDTFIITVDTDKIYSPELARVLSWHASQDDRVAFGACGWGFYWRAEPQGVAPLYIPWTMRYPYGRHVDVLQCVCGNIYRRSFFNDKYLHLLSNPHPACFTTDDLWIAGFLAVLGGDPTPDPERAAGAANSIGVGNVTRGISRVVIPVPDGAGTSSLSPYVFEPKTPAWKSAKSHDARFDLSSHNMKAGVDMACIRGLEESLGPWRTIRLNDHKRQRLQLIHPHQQQPQPR